MNLMRNKATTLVNKIIISVVGYIIVVMLLFSVLIFVIDYIKSNSMNADYAKNMALVESKLVSDWFMDRQKEIQSIGYVIDPSRLDDSVNKLQSIQKKNSDLYRQFFYVDIDGNYVDTFGQKSKMKEKLFEPLYSKQKEYLITDPEIHPVLSEVLTNIVVPIVENDKVIGVFGGTLAMDVLSSRLEAVKSFESGYGWLADDKLRFMAHPNKDRLLRISLYEETYLQEQGLNQVMSSTKAGFKGLVFDKQGPEVGKLYYYTNPEGYRRAVLFESTTVNPNWLVAHTMYVDKIPSSTGNLLMAIVIGLLIFVIATVIMSYYFANRLVNPIKELNHVMALFIGGNTGVRATARSKDEIGDLSKGFNEMAATIIKQTDNVEELIKERTQILADINYRIVARNKELDTMNKELSTTNSKLHSLATTDMLTGLQNRHELLRTLQSLVEDVLRGESKEFSILFVDLDNFKYYNDTFSHEIGDFILIEVSNILKSNVRENDMVARYGGDEFIVLLKHGNYELSKLLSERIHSKILEKEGFKKPIERKIGASIDLLGKNKLSCSIGIVNYNKNTEAKNAEELLALADDTMYKAKKAGKSRIVVH